MSLKILWLGVDRTQRAECHVTDDFIEAVKRIADVEVVQKSGKYFTGKHKTAVGTKKLDPGMILENTLDKKSDYDFIYCDTMHMYLKEPWKNINIPSGFNIVDLHNKFAPTYISTGMDAGMYIFPTYQFSTLSRILPTTKNYNRKCWLPFSIDYDKFKYYGIKNRDVILSGAAGNVYPFRKKSINELSNTSYFEYIQRSKDPFETNKPWPIGNDYINLLSESKICLSCGTKHNYALIKYFEIGGCSVICSPWFDELSSIGLKHGENMIAADPKNLDMQLQSYLKNEKELMKLQTNCRKLMIENHSVNIRAKQFINYICNIIGKDKEFKEIKSL